jgi:antitoxin (DNA-binding transcriptional repressor) of toxin-antitoxin stability system
MKGTVTPSQLYGHMGEYLGRIRWGGESYTVQKRGRPIARLEHATDVSPGKDGKRRYPLPPQGSSGAE